MMEYEVYNGILILLVNFVWLWMYGVGLLIDDFGMGYVLLG